VNKTRKARVVFVGAGHAHLNSIKNAGLLIRQGAEVIVIGPDQYHYYSGMGPGMLSGIYKPDDVRVDAQRLTISSGARFIKGHVIGIDPHKKNLHIDNRERLPYDIASFNLGSSVPTDLVKGAHKEAYPIKPIAYLVVLKQTILSKITSSIPRILIIGTGPAGVEIAGNIQRLVSQNEGKAEIILLGAEESLLHRFPEKAGLFARDSLLKRDITIFSRCLVSSLDNGIARTSDHREIAYDIAVLATGIRPVQVFEGSGIDTAQNGSLLINSYLQSTSHPDIFGGGDCVTFRNMRLDMVGVYAVRQAPILLHNIQARLKGEPLKEFVPQKRYLLIFNLGDGSGIFVRSPLVLKGRWAFRLKDFIDKRFISKFQQ
jgi:NADH dehydrogenase FAD-containing subunit